MAAILTVFIIALILSWSLTPLAGWVGYRIGALDKPDDRKVHNGKIPRTGGLVIFLVFLVTIVISSFIITAGAHLVLTNRQMASFLFGCMISFGIGFIDDFLPQGPKTKFLFQIIAASCAYWGGVRIAGFHLFGWGFHFGLFSYLVTIFWFLLFMNAINLMDGLDGLAGGIVFFASLVMVVLSVLRHDLMVALLFAGLAGSILGFLRYNFNPASIFLGDGGSYFLGYVVAGLSILGSVKSQLGAAMLIPILALGVPIFDTILAPLRRFMHGRKMFHPDNGHIHHRLMENGFSTQKAVYFIHALSACLCVLALFLVEVRDNRSGLFLIFLGIGAILFIKKLGYFEYLAYDKFYGWLKDLSDETGISRGRRTFLSLQIDINHSKNLEALWRNMARALDLLEFDEAAFYLNSPMAGKNLPEKRIEFQNINVSDRRRVSTIESSIGNRRTPPEWRWTRNPLNREETLDSRCFLRLELPMVSARKVNYGNLVLLKDLRSEVMNQFVLRRVEQLRRSTISALEEVHVDFHKDFSDLCN